MAKLTIKELLNSFPQQGKVDWIGLRPARRESILKVSEVEALRELGLVGDRYCR